MSSSAGTRAGNLVKTCRFSTFGEAVWPSSCVPCSRSSVEGVPSAAVGVQDRVSPSWLSSGAAGDSEVEEPVENAVEEVLKAVASAVAEDAAGAEASVEAPANGDDAMGSDLSLSFEPPGPGQQK